MSPRTPYRSWPGALAVLLAILTYVGGLKWWDNRTPGSRPLTAGETVSVGQARFVPSPDWQMDVARSRPGQTLMLFKGNHKFLVSVAPWAGGRQGPLSRQRRLMERGQGLRIDGDASSFITSWGLQGETFAYYGPHLAGRFWQVVDVQRRSLVQVDFYGGNEDLNDALLEARDMLESMDIDAPP
ncbi:MAG: hypothetical protein EOP76_15300 [Variovorax sp.]|nr:MAG: hypothetical protein EOP76_15300 [Variovorax sp.]